MLAPVTITTRPDISTSGGVIGLAQSPAKRNVAAIGLVQPFHTAARGTIGADIACRSILYDIARLEVR